MKHFHLAAGRMLTILAGLCLASCATQPNVATAPQPETCRYPWARVRAAAPDDVRLTEIPEPQDFLKAYNAHPPVSEVEAERVFAATQGSSVLLFFIVGDCTIGKGRIPMADFLEILGAGA